MECILRAVEVLKNSTFINLLFLYNEQYEQAAGDGNFRARG